MATLTELDTLVDANPDTARGIAAAYEALLGGVPTIDGFVYLINTAVATNFGSNNPNVVFNQENIFINLTNSLVQGNPAAGAQFTSITAGAATLQDQLTAIYDGFVPLGRQTAEGRAFFSRPEAQAFYQAVAAERGVASADGAGIVALASLLKILVTEDIGIGDDVNDLMAAIDDGSAALPENGSSLTPIEVADGSNFDDDDDEGAGIDLTTGTDALTGTQGGDLFNGEAVQTGPQPVQTLNNSDDLDGDAGRDVLNAQLVDMMTAPVGLAGIEEINVETLGTVPGDVALDALHADAVDTIGFRSVGDVNANFNNLSVLNIATALDRASIRDSSGANLGLSFIGDALDGGSDELNLTVANSPGVRLILDYAAGAANGSEGHEIANISSVGSLNNSLALQGNVFQTINVAGTANFLISSLEIGPLQLFDASTLTGFLFSTFANDTDDGGDGVADEITVRGGGGADFMRFEGELDNAASAFGNGGDDVFDLQTHTALDGEASFTAEDSVDGGDGNDQLRIAATGIANGPTVDLLAAGVGSNIVGVESIRHTGEPEVLADLSINWSRKGSATTLELGAVNYGLHRVEITGLTNDDTIIFDSPSQVIYDMSLKSLNGAASLSDEINLVYETDFTIAHLTTDPATELLRIDTRDSSFSAISGAGTVESDMVITGAGTFYVGAGFPGGSAYDKAGGTIDGSAATGDLVLYLGQGELSASGGSGDDFISTEQAAQAHIALDAGGNDLIVFTHDVLAADMLISNFQGHVSGFDSDDKFFLAVDSGEGVAFQNAGVASVSQGDQVMISQLGTGGIVNAPAGGNFIKLTTAVATDAGDTFQDAFDTAIGGGSVNSYFGLVALGSVYDSTNSQMLLIAIAPGGNGVQAGDTVGVVATIGMSMAEYTAFGADQIGFSYI